jgi:hypothetical protein
MIAPGGCRGLPLFAGARVDRLRTSTVPDDVEAMATSSWAVLKLTGKMVSGLFRLPRLCAIVK